MVPLWVGLLLPYRALNYARARFLLARKSPSRVVQLRSKDLSTMPSSTASQEGRRRKRGMESWSKRSSRRIDRRGIISSDLEENLIIILEEKRGAFVVPSCGGGVNNGAVVARHEWEFDDSTRSVFVRLESGQVRSMKGDRRFIKGWRIEICLG